jgi:hypothetical protein
MPTAIPYGVMKRDAPPLRPQQGLERAALYVLGEDRRRVTRLVVDRDEPAERKQRRVVDGRQNAHLAVEHHAVVLGEEFVLHHLHGDDRLVPGVARRVEVPEGAVADVFDLRGVRKSHLERLQLPRENAPPVLQHPADVDIVAPALDRLKRHDDLLESRPQLGILVQALADHPPHVLVERGGQLGAVAGRDQLADEPDRLHIARQERQPRERRIEQHAVRVEIRLGGAHRGDRPDDLGRREDDRLG